MGSPLIPGLMESKTVTVAVAFSVFPQSSVPVNVAVWAPVVLQSKDVGDTVSVSEVVQLSLEPLSMCEALNEKLPLAFR